jgi:hypothetical protein
MPDLTGGHRRNITLLSSRKRAHGGISLMPSVAPLWRIRTMTVSRKVVLSLAFLSCLVSASAQAQLFVDEFTTFHDYTSAGGSVPAGGIWTGIHNAANGSGPGGVPVGIIQSNGMDAFSNPKPGVLFMEDLNGGPTGTGIGWEGNRTTAPFIFRDVPASEDFDAKIKINAQTAGNWSSAGVLARVKGPAVGGAAIDPLENFVSATTFRTNTADLTQVNLLTKRIQNGAQVLDANNAFGGGPAADPEPLPLWVRLTKQGTTFTSQSSLNGTQWFTETVVAAPEVAPVGGTMEVGLVFQMFGGSAGEVEIDSYSIFVGTQPPTDFTWSPVGAGAWGTVPNWSTNTTPGAPNGNTAIVRFGSAITAASTVYTDTNVMAKRLEFNNANKYAVAGTGTITLDADSGNAQIGVLLGSHEIQASLALLNDNLDVSAAAGTRLDINNRLNLNGKTMNITGAGIVSVNNRLDTGTSGLVANAGTLQGTGTINGSLENNAGGIVSPGNSPGTLSVDGTYVQAGGSTLLMELGGTSAGSFDKLAVGGALTAGGTLDIDLINGFTPTAGNSWDILDFASTSGSFTLSLPALSPGLSWNTSSLLTSGVVSVVGPGGIDADFNNDNIVNGTDFLIWQRNNGASGASNAQGDSNSDGLVNAADLGNWKSRFGLPSGEAVTVSIPEPATMSLLGAGALLGFVVRRKRVCA